LTTASQGEAKQNRWDGLAGQGNRRSDQLITEAGEGDPSPGAPAAAAAGAIRVLLI